jgi:hypothetical protein
VAALGIAMVGNFFYYWLHRARAPQPKFRHHDARVGRAVRHGLVPPSGEWPEVGLDDVPEPWTIREYLLMPFGRRQS